MTVLSGCVYGVPIGECQKNCRYDCDGGESYRASINRKNTTENRQ